MTGESCFQEISAGAISGSMPHCIAIVVNVGDCNVTPLLKQTYSQRNYTVYVAETSAAKLPQVLERCREIGVPAIVNCTAGLPQFDSILPKGEPYSAAVVSPGSYGEHSKEGKDIISYILNDPCATNASCIGFQGYYFSPCKTSLLRSRYFEQMRLGALREDITLVEPLLRDTAYTFIDLNAVRHSDYPCTSNPYPNGLYAEEICQMARYIGFGLGLKGVFIHGFPQQGEDGASLCNRLVSEFIWHLCEAISSNIAEYPALNPDNECFIRKIISLGENGEEIVFVNSSTTDRWWMEILSPEHKTPIYVPCSMNDYKAACCGEVPLRWLFFYQKLTIL